MRVEEALPALRKGKKIRRNFWRKDTYFYKNRQGTFIFKNGGDNEYYYNLTHLLDGDDWEIIDENKIVKLRDLTEEQFNEWVENNCRLYSNCKDCPFNIVECSSSHNNFRLKHKDLFSDKFLDQEIEVEE